MLTMYVIQEICGIRDTEFRRLVSERLESLKKCAETRFLDIEEKESAKTSK